MRLKKFEEFSFKDENLCKKCGSNPSTSDRNGYCTNCEPKKNTSKVKKDTIQIPNWGTY